MQALLLSAMRANIAKQRPGALLRALLEAHGAWRDGPGSVTHVRAGPLPGQELLANEAERQAARQAGQ